MGFNLFFGCGRESIIEYIRYLKIWIIIINMIWESGGSWLLRYFLVLFYIIIYFYLISEGEIVNGSCEIWFKVLRIWWWF